MKEIKQEIKGTKNEIGKMKEMKRKKGNKKGRKETKGK
jgi:hypothetical protein